MMLWPEICVAPVTRSFSCSQFLVGKQQQLLSSLRTGSLDTRFLSTIWYHTMYEGSEEEVAMKKNCLLQTSLQEIQGRTFSLFAFAC